MITRIDQWYDRRTRSWVVQRMDAQGNQVGDAEYVYTRREADLIRRQWEVEYNLNRRTIP